MRPTSFNDAARCRILRGSRSRRVAVAMRVSFRACEP